MSTIVAFMARRANQWASAIGLAGSILLSPLSGLAEAGPGSQIMIQNNPNHPSLDSRSPPPDGVPFVAGQIEFLFKGFALTRGCLQSALSSPGPLVTQGSELLLECSRQDYAENETLVYRVNDNSCSVLGSDSTGTIAYELPVHAPFKPGTDSLEAVSDALFDEDNSALLALNLRTSELTRIGTLDCDSSGSNDFLFADDFESNIQGKK